MDSVNTVNLKELSAAYELWSEAGIWTDAPNSPRELCYNEYFRSDRKDFLLFMTGMIF